MIADLEANVAPADEEEYKNEASQLDQSLKENLNGPYINDLSMDAQPVNGDSKKRDILYISGQVG